MSQHDMALANQSRSAFRADLNDALVALVSLSSGASAPATTFAYQWWADTTTGLLKIRNAANSAWVTIGTLASANLGLLPLTGGSLTGDLAIGTGLGGTQSLTIKADPGSVSKTIFDPGTGVNLGTIEYDHSVKSFTIRTDDAIAMTIDSAGDTIISGSVKSDAANSEYVLTNGSGSFGLRSSGSALEIRDHTPDVSRLSLDSSGAFATGAASVATGYTAAGDITLPATGKIRAKNTNKAQITFDGTGTPAALGTPFNVTSITDNGTGDYTLNLTNATPDAFYGLAICCKNANDAVTTYLGSESSQTARTTTAVRIRTFALSGGYVDPAVVTVTLT